MGKRRFALSDPEVWKKLVIAAASEALRIPFTVKDLWMLRIMPYVSLQE